MENAAVNMYDYHVWANQTMLDRLSEIPQEVYVKEIPSVFSSISKVMPHIYMVDQTWLGILSGQSMQDAMGFANECKEQIESKSVAELKSMFLDLSGHYRAFFNRETNLDQTLRLDNPYAGIRDTSLTEIVLQVVNHGTYHRGNVTAMLRQLGHPSVMTEYALYWYSKTHS